MNIKLKFQSKFLPKRSLFGFKVLNIWQSIISAYFFIIIERLVIPFFGYENAEVKASLFFIALTNTSVFILIINSLIRIRKFNLILLFFEVPLVFYTPRILNKIFISFAYLIELFRPWHDLLSEDINCLYIYFRCLCRKLLECSFY